MLIIRSEQMKALSQHMVKRFEDRLVEHLHLEFPDVCRSLGNDGVRGIVADGIRQAEGYGIRVQNDIGRYLNLMFLFGQRFDSDPEHRWASTLLRDAKIADPRVRMDLLYEEAATHLADAAGILAKDGWVR